MSISTLSVLIPCHNAAAHVAAALDSVLAQDCPATEVIVVNDGSTDGSAQVLEDYRARGVMVIHQDNGGAASARNRAFAASRGDAVVFFDADDIMGCGHLSALAVALTRPRTIAMSRWGRFHADLQEALFPDRPTERDMSGPDWLLVNWAKAQPMTQPGMFLVPRSLIDNFGGWDERLSLIDDFEFYARMIARSDGVRFAPGARLYYRSGLAGSLSGQRSRRAVESEALSLILGTGHLLAAEDSPRTRAAAAAVLQAFDYNHYPLHPDLRADLTARARALGGSTLPPSGPPNFHRLRRLVGWKAARRIQRLMGR